MPTLAKVRAKIPVALKAAKGTKATPTGETFIANNGLSYQALDNGKVRRTYPDMPTDEELAILDAGTVRQRMKALYAILRAEAPDDTVQKGGYIHCRGYKMRYTADTFEILDAHNFYKPSTKFNPDDDSARAVANFIFRRNIDKEIKVREKAATKTIEPVNQMREAMQKAETQKQEKIKVLKKEKAPEKSLEQLRTEALSLIAQTRNKEMKPAELLDQIQNYVPFRTLRVRIGKLIRAYQNKQVRMPKLLDQLHITVSEVIFDQRKPAPKFNGTMFYDVVSLYDNGPDHVTMTLRDTKEKVTTTKSEFMARYVLSEWPELMPLLMKVVNGEEYRLEDLQEVGFVIKDKFVEYSDKQFSRVNNHAYLLEVIEEFLAANSEPSPLNYVYGTALKKGDKVKVMWLDDHTYHMGVVTSANDGPVKLRYEDGTVLPLFKHQPVKVQK